MSNPGLTVEVTCVLPVIPESIDEGAGEAFKDVGVIVEVDEDREAVEL